MDAGLIFTEESSPLAAELAEVLKAIGLVHETGDCLTIEMLDALNAYRYANALPALDFADPVTLRSLGIERGGDEILALARYAQENAVSEIAMFDVCRGVLEACQAHGITIAEYTKMSGPAEISSSAALAAVLAMLY